MGSVDGRLLTERWTEPFDGKSKGDLTGVYAAIGRRLNTDAWMFGKRTLCEGYFPGYSMRRTAPRWLILRPMLPRALQSAALWQLIRTRISSMNRPP